MSQPISALWTAVIKAEKAAERASQYAESCFRTLHNLYDAHRTRMDQLERRMDALEAWSQGE